MEEKINRINILPKVGDQIECLYMEKESEVTPGTLGIVTKIQRDPVVEDSFIISVDWENGSHLSLITESDTWRVLEKKNLKEGTSHSPHNFFVNNEEIFENFNWRWFKKYLEVLRKSGIVNMFGAAPFLYMGKEHLERYYGEGKEDDEDFQELFNLADTSREKMVQGVVKYLESTGKDWDLDDANRKIGRFASKIVELYWVFH